LDGNHRTNNIVEGNNHRFSLLLPVKTTDWIVIDRFKTEESMTKSSLHQVAMGNTGQNHNTSHYLKHQDQEDKLRSIVSNLNIMSLSQFRQYLALSWATLWPELIHGFGSILLCPGNTVT
jgi:hypothetical protein